MNEKAGEIQSITVKKAKTRYNIKIYLSGIPVLILLKFKEKKNALSAFEKVKAARMNNAEVEIQDDYEKVLIDTSQIIYLSFS